MSKLTGKNDGPGGRNEHYDVGNRTNVPRRNIVAEIKRGEHPDTHIVKINDREYARDNLDRSMGDNVNKKQIVYLGSVVLHCAKTYWDSHPLPCRI